VLLWEKSIWFEFILGWISFRDSSWHSQLLCAFELNLNYKKMQKMNHTMRVMKRFRIIQAFGWKVGSKVKIWVGYSYMGIFSWSTCLSSLRDFVKSKWNAHLHVNLSVEWTHLNFAWANAHVLGLKSNFPSALNSKPPLCFSCLF